MKTILRLAVISVSILFIAGCINMPTPPAQITGASVSSDKYESMDCSRLAVEMNFLAKRENQLTTAQDQRIKTSQVQSFWWGFGKGDGLEASELANVRGEKEAVRTAMEANNCSTEN